MVDSLLFLRTLGMHHLRADSLHPRAREGGDFVAGAAVMGLCVLLRSQASRPA